MAKSWTAISLVMLVILGVSACGVSSGSGAARSNIVLTAAKVYDLTMSANSADFQLRFAVSPTGAHSSVISSESGTYSWATNQGTITTASSLSGLFAITTREIVDGNVTYTKLISKSGPQSTFAGLGFSQGSGWTESTVSGSGQAGLWSFFFQGFADLLGGFLAQQSLINPAVLLTILRSESGPAADVGNEVVDGSPTAHYRMLIPFSTLVGQKEASRLSTEIFGTGNLMVDYWVDSGNRLRMLRLAIIMPRPPKVPQPPPPSTPTTSSPGAVVSQGFSTTFASGQPYKFPVTTSVTLQLSDYGAASQVSLPPQSEITSKQACTVSSSGFDCSGL
jgi:hypothetical protein